MRWPFISTQNDLTTKVLFTLGFAFHQHLNAACQHAEFRFLTRDDIGQFFDRPRQMGNLFF